MTQEEKAKRYDEAITKARNIVNSINVGLIGKDSFEAVFPELKESEDEKMRKFLIKTFKSYQNPKTHLNPNNWEGINISSILAWLEKKGEQKSADTDNKFIRMRETKPKDISEFLDRLTTVEQEFLWEHIAKIRELDKNEQKPADKVEPKFHEGDWIITNKKHVWYVDETPKTTSYLYRLINQYGKVEVAEFEVVDEKARLWTIQDAKDGDVLFTSSTASYETFIFKSIDERGNAECYFSYDSEDGFREGKYHFIGRVTNCKPATKEQRDLLFQKMKEAGYEWDAEKKELKKIEQKPTNNVIEEEKPLLEKFKQAVYDCAWGKVTCKKEGETKEEYANRWAEHFLLIVRDWADDYIDFTIQQKLRNSYEKGKTDIIEKQDEQNPAWSEEDERMYKAISIALSLKDAKGYLKSWYTTPEEADNWLKSLKDRIGNFDDGYKVGFSAAKHNQWKPSDGQIECLSYAIEKAEKDWFPLTNNRVYITLKALEEQLKKLREE